ncbi:MAG TPA: hypothetical protein VK144_02130 [Bacillota bacterium]|nr:hypothetical protein [Bacillota bacterium]
MSKNTHITDIVKQFGFDEMAWYSSNDGTLRIHDGKKSFVLCQARMDEEHLKRWETVFRVANEKKIRSIVPIYPTLKGDLYVKDNQRMYYLTPYIEETHSCSPTDVMSEIGVIHAQSNHTFLIEKKTLRKKYSTYKNKLQAKQIELRQLIDLFEQQRYMSPLGLQVCTHFHIVDDAITIGMEHVDAIIRICTEDEHEHVEWSSSICHNRLSMDNVIKNHQIYVKNWEGVTFDNGTTDLVRFLKNEFLRNEFPIDVFVEGLHAYEKNKPFSLIEKHMLHVHLLHPIHYMNMAASIRIPNQKTSHLQSVIALERAFRVISSSLHVLSTYEQPVNSD